MKYFIDTEYYFEANNTGHCMARIIPLSIGIVAEDGRELYRALTDALWQGIFPPFVVEHVLPVIGDTFTDTPLIVENLRTFIGDDTPEFWGDYADFDYVVLSTIMGGFDNWPENWPMFVNDLQQSGIESRPSDIPHNALSDARALRDAFEGALIQVG